MKKLTIMNPLETPNAFIERRTKEIHTEFTNKLDPLMQNLLIAFNDNILTKEQKQIWERAILFSMSEAANFKHLSSGFKFQVCYSLYHLYHLCHLSSSSSPHVSDYMINKYNDGLCIIHNKIFEVITNLKIDIDYLVLGAQRLHYSKFKGKDFLNDEVSFMLSEFEKIYPELPQSPIDYMKPSGELESLEI